MYLKYSKIILILNICYLLLNKKLWTIKVTVAFFALDFSIASSYLVFDVPSPYPEDTAMASLNERDDDRTERPVSRPRSRNFPAMSLGKAVDWLSEIRDALGFKPFSKTMLAQAFNLSSTSGSFFAKVGAMNAYGLLEGSSEQLRISDVGKRILAPQSDEDRRNAIQKAFQTPDLFADLLRDFGGSPLPQQLANRLLHQYSITDASKDVAAQSFIESARFAGLLEDSGVLRR